MFLFKNQITFLREAEVFDLLVIDNSTFSTR